MRDTIDMAREAGLLPILNEDAFQKWEWEKTKNVLKRFAELVRADERNSWPAEMEAMERQVNILTDALAAEREACAKVCETGIDYEHPTVKGHIMENFGHSRLLAAAIRARGNK